MLLGGLALRLTIAYVLFPSSGFESDIASYASWALTIGEYGPSGFYANAGFADYPPAYLYLLWPLGLLSGAAEGLAAADLVKLPPILLDIAVGYVLYRLVRGWTWPGERSERLALVAAALYLFNPVSFYDSALWGQTDAAGALILLLGIAALIRGNSEGAAAFAATAALVKPQFGVVLIPLVAFVLVKRHLIRPGSGPRNEPWAPRGLAGWLAVEQGWLRLLTSFAAAWLAFFVVALPFGMGPLEYLERMFGTAGGYGYLSVNAYNLWSLVGSGGTPALATSLGWSDDTIGLIGPIPGVVVGALLLAAGFLWGTLRGAARDDRWTLLVAVTFLAIAFFVLPTRVHERYIFPAIALLPLLAVMQRRWGLALLLLSVGAFINLHGILTLPIYGSDNVSSLPFGELFRTQPLIVLSALLQTGVGAWAAWQLRPGLRTSPDAYDEEAHGPARPAPDEAEAPASAVELAEGDAGALDEEWARGPSALDWVVARFSRTPRRPDRSGELASERGGRIDRLDLLVLVVLVLVTLTIRGYRLDQPAGMYFDEVYHARTATEFLQDWEYGQPHDIYEFTHPHLAKYVMAWGIRLFGGNAVTGAAELGVPVRDAALEQRWAPSEAAGVRNGDRLYVATGESLLAYDLATRDLLAAIAVEASSVVVDQDRHTLYVSDPFGVISALDTTLLDAFTPDEEEQPLPAVLSNGPGTPIEQLVVTESSLVAIGTGSISTFDLESGLPLSQRLAVATTDAVALPWADRLVVDVSQVADVGSAAAQIGDILLDDEERIERLLASGGFVVVAAYLDEDEKVAIEAAVVDGSLAGASIESGPLLATADNSGISILDGSTLDLIDEIPTAEAVSALTLVERGLSDPTLYAAAGSALEVVPISDDGAGLPRTLSMPGPVRDLAWNEPATLVHVLGDAPDGGPTVYVVEPNGNSVFIDVPLPHEPRRLIADTQPQWPEQDRGELLAISADGSVASVGIDQNAFGWRFPGVILGALAAALLYLLARVLFARRSIALITAVLIVAEGMLFANSRIAMNDVYVTTFIILAVLSVAPLYLAARRPWTAILLLLGAGVALGIALASKWVALYAIGGLGLLVLLRSGLGRVTALLGMIALTSVLGAMAIRPSPIEDPSRNWAFLVLMMLLTGLLAAGMVRRPIPFSRTEVGLVVVMPLVAGIGLALIGRPLLGGVLAFAGMAALVVAVVLTRRGHGPFAGPGPRPDRTTSGWLRPGWLLGIPWLITLAALVLVPVGVYVLSYSPWVELGNEWGLPVLGSLPFLAESNEGGRSLADLTESMYQYHDNLRAEHAASSPWWAWPLDLKPVWFFQERYAGPTTALIYDTGNLVVFWLGIAGIGFSAFAAWRRHSVALALVVVMWAALWLPWARIDRAAFQYHVYASLPFLVLALAYFLAELWHGASLRVWFLARVAGALGHPGDPAPVALPHTPLHPGRNCGGPSRWRRLRLGGDADGQVERVRRGRAPARRGGRRLRGIPRLACGTQWGSIATARSRQPDVVARSSRRGRPPLRSAAWSPRSCSSTAAPRPR